MMDKMQHTENLVSLFFTQAERLKDKPFLWQKQGGVYQPLSWAECADTVIKLACALKEKGIEKGDRVVLVSENRSEWALADLAIMAAGAITVPTYITNTLNDHQHILNNSQAKAAFISTPKLAETFLRATHQANDIEFVVSIEQLPLKQELSHPIYHWNDMLKDVKSDGSLIQKNAEQIKSDETACIIYTSGTGGRPKGVMLAHHSILHNCIGATAVLKPLGLGDDVFLSFLPLSHAYEHTAGLMFPIYLGAQIYYAESAEKLVQNMTECRPTLMTAVPRLYEMIRTKILRNIEQQGGKKEQLFKKAVQLGIDKYLGRRLGLLGTLQHFALEWLVRHKIRQRFGGRLKAFVSGGAPLHQEVGLFFQGMGVRILQGYGQTESGPVVCVNTPEKIKMHTVGPALANTELKIATDGELLVRGDLVMQGYWRDEKTTQSVIKQGWLHTGDIGFIDEDGYLQITDRKKDIIVNSGGDNISPQRIEGYLSLEKEIAQCMVYGDQRSHLVALIIPDEEYAFEWAKKNEQPQDLNALVKNDKFYEEISKAVTQVNSQLSKIDKVRKFILSGEPFTVENEQMTPTLKIRRHVIEDQYGDALSKLYG